MVATPPGRSNEATLASLGIPVQAPDDLGAALQLVYRTLDAADLHYGHGTDSAWDEAVLLMLCACGLPVDAGDEALRQELTTEQWDLAVQWLSRRINERTPLPYLLGRAWFAGLEFRCDPRALVPRSPLAEVIADEYRPWWPGDAAPRQLLDLCCGGGCIGIAAAVYAPSMQLTLADIDREALALARENVALHGVSERTQISESDLFDGLAGATFDIILSNPPYVDAGDIASMPAEYHAEPERGLGSGADGLDLARRILSEAYHFLNPGGLLFMELGNSWEALDALLPALPLTWLEFSSGGHGVLLVQREDLPPIAQRLAQC